MEARRARELAAWEAVLPALYPEIAAERVVDVVAVSSGRILLLTDTHVAMLKVPLQYPRPASFCSPTPTWRCSKCRSHPGDTSPGL